MSLRDALVAIGLVKKKDVARANRELNEERRAEQGGRRPQAEIDRELAAQRAEAEAAEQAARLRERDEREARKADVERRLRIENVLRANAIRPGKGQPFWHRAHASPQVLRLEVSSGVAWQLRSGEAGIAASVRADLVDYVVLPKKAIHKLRELAPELVVFFVDDTAGISAPELHFHTREWETDLAPHRATGDDITRLTEDG